MRKQLFVLLTIFFIKPVCSMEGSAQLPCSFSLVTKDIACNAIQPLLSLQDIAHIKQCSHAYNQLYDVDRICPLLCEDVCSNSRCNELGNNYYACSKALAHFAVKNDEDMFRHLWFYHAAIRNSNVANIMKKKIPKITIKDKMNIYRKKYSESKSIDRHIFNHAYKAIEVGNVEIANTVLANIKLDIFALFDCYSVLENLSKERFNPDFIFFRLCELNNINLIKILCGGMINKASLDYIMLYADDLLLCELISQDILPVDTVSSCEKSVLHYAAERGLENVIQLALEKGAYVNCMDSKGRTPLHYAVKHAKGQAILILLVNPDADVRFTDKKGKRVIDYALSVNKYLSETPSMCKYRKAIRSILKSHLEQHNVSPYSYSKVHDNGYQKLHI